MHHFQDFLKISLTIKKYDKRFDSNFFVTISQNKEIQTGCHSTQGTDRRIKQHRTLEANTSLC